ncbi:MAG: hypothetical protein CW338_02710 [Clostridiales bacterium]|nr:hypothetical protein [Clostridiales bacterium]
MTERLYYDASYMTDFSAYVTAVKEDQGGTWVTLDRSAFYPTSGGQPFDTGILKNVDTGEELPVTDVEVADGDVWHRVEGALQTGDEVLGRIDWPRRFDHMQQHGGEHMIAGSIWKLLHGTTIGLHLGKDQSTIDVTMPDGRTRFTEEETAAVEQYVNGHIQRNEPVRCWFPDEAELASLPLRKPPTVTEHIRIVDIGGWEMVACGGTHPASTGEIGLVKILSVTPARGKARVSFVCGERALRYFDLCQKSAEKAGQLLSATPERLADAVAEMKEKCARLESELKAFRTQDILRQLEKNSGVLYLENGDDRALQEAVSAYIQRPGRIVFAGAGGRLIFARSADRNEDMAALIRSVARGGGKPDMASGAGGRDAVLAAARSAGLL